MDASNFVAPGSLPGTFVVVVNGQMVGTFNSQSEAEQAFNANKGTSSGGGSMTPGYQPANEPAFPTPNGMRTISQMRQELASAGYNGPSDDGSVMAAYSRTAGAAAPSGQYPGGGMGGGGFAGAGLGGLADAAASGNREQWAQGMRERFIAQHGYDPGPMFGYGGYGQDQGPAGSYSTSNGSRTVDQMRQELKTAGFPNWEQADENEIVAVYQRTTGGPVTKGGTGSRGDQPQQINQGFAQRIKDVYRQVAQQKGVPSLSADDPDLVRAVAAATRLSPQEAQRILQVGKDVYIATGREITDADLQQHVNKAMPFGENPSMDARRFTREGEVDERNFGRLTGRDREDDTRWRTSFGEGQHQFDANQYSDFAKTLIAASTQMRGPRDYFQYQQMLGNGRDVLSVLQGDTPQARFGMSGQPEAARVTDILSGIGLDFRGRSSPRPPVPDDEMNFEQMKAGGRRRF